MAMAENDRGDTASSKGGEAWGTLEELLLACTVSRHGSNSWDSIAMEVQKRSTSMNGNCQMSNGNNFSIAFTPHSCRQRYHALKRRFDVTRGNEAGGEHELRDKIPFIVDELRKLRVEELRREVERHDVSIVSLQLKVKRLEDERERTTLKAEAAGGDADLRARVDRSDAGDQRRSGIPDGSSAEVADKSISSQRSDELEDRSFNESNSTSQKGAQAQGKESNRMREPVKNSNNKPDPVRDVVESEPDKDSSSTRGGASGCGLEEERVVGRTNQPVRLGISGELRESVSELKRELAGEVKQSSDVQSPASLSRKQRRGDGGGVGSSGDEMDAEELSPANKRMDVKSQPLIKFMGILRSHEDGPVFQRRLPRQETEGYRNVVRQHMDLETVQSNLDLGIYYDCQSKFYRDLLLTFTNATLYFCKTSAEQVAAHELRKMVTKEIVAQREAQKPKPAPLVKPATDLESQILDSVVKRPRSSTNIVVCRRRTNPNAVKPSLQSSELMIPKNKKEGVENADHHKDEPEKLIGRSLAKTAISNNTGGSGNKKSQGAVQGESSDSNNASASDNNKGKKDESSDDEEEHPINKRQRLLQQTLQKQGVVNFLKRMKQNLPSKEVVAAKANNDAQEEQEKVMKKTEISKKKVVVGKKKDNGDGGGAGNDDNASTRSSGRRTTKVGDDNASTRSSGRRTTKVGEETGRSNNTRRGGGRPPTRKEVVGGSGTPDSGRGNRQRDGDKEVSASGRGTTAAKKKSRGR